MESNREGADAYALGSDHLVDEDGAHPSAYTAPAHLRLQAEPGHASSTLGQQQKRGDLTADNLGRIPEADQVAPGIRLENAGNDYDVQQQERKGQRGRDGQSNDQRSNARGSNEEIREHGQGDDMLLDHSAARYSARAPSSMDLSGRSSTSVIDHDDQEHFHDADMASDGGEDESADLVHERVGGSGATSENASKGTSVGHFGPRGEAIPGVPPHLDPRQPHFRPPSPSAASVFSVAVQPPVSPKAQAASIGQFGSSSTPQGTLSGEVVDSGEETESFDNGALTPTLSDEFGADYDTEERIKQDGEHLDGGSASGGAYTKAGPSFSIQRMNLDGDDHLAASSSGPFQVSFSPVVTSHHRGSISGYSGRAPSVAATAGSSRAPSTRGLSPPAPTSRAGTTEGSSIGEFSQGLGDNEAETPSVGRSRRSSYSAPSSEHEGGQVGAGGVGALVEDVNSRARGSTLISTHQPASSHGVPLGLSTTASSTYADAGDDEGPSLAPSEAGSDSTRSMTYESSTGHGASAPALALGLAPSTTNSERYPLGWSSAALAGSGIPSPAVFDQSSASSAAGIGIGSTEEVNQQGLGSASAASATFKHPLSTGNTPVLPSLLAIKRASRRHGSGPASTAATAGTASPPSSISVDGDFEDASSESPVPHSTTTGAT